MPRTGPPPLSFAQERIHLLQQLEPENTAYNKSLIRRLKGPLNLATLEQTLQEILRRHEVLRTTLPAQEVLPVPPERIAVTDCRPFPDPAAEARRLIGEEIRRPFDLGTGPLLRTRLFRLDREDHVLFLGTHQVCCDDQSTGILLQELTTLYAAFAQGQPSPLPEPPVQYADYACWQRDRLQGEVLEEQLAFWREQLRPPVPRLNLSTSRHSRAISRSLDIPARLHDALRTLSRQEGTTLFMTLLAAFQTLLFRCTMQEEDILVFSSVGGRNRTEIRGLIGLFTNVLALRTNLSANPPFRELLGRVRETALGAFSHQDLPFEQLLDLLHSGAGQAPPLQVLFVLQNASMPELELPGVQVEPFRVDTEGTSQFDMVWYFKETDAGLSAWLRYRTELSGLATVMAENMQTLLEGIVADPDQRLTDLPCLSEEERQGLPVFINQDQAVPDADRPSTETYVAPRNPQEQQLASIWEEVLKTAPVGIHDNFFDLGGTSIAALTLLRRIQERFGSDLSLATLFQAQTVAQQAEIVRKRGRASALVPLQPRGSKPPFFYVPPAGSTALGGAKFAQYFGTDQPFYGLQPLGFEKGETPHNRVEDMAAYYIQAIRELQPEGPYYLGGTCFGAHVAFGMGQQLHKQGDTVELLALFDPGLPHRTHTAAPRRNAATKIVHYISRSFFHLRQGQFLRIALNFFVYRRGSLFKRIVCLLDTEKRRIETVWTAHYAAQMEYMPHAYPGKTVLFRSSQYHDMEQKGEGVWARRWSEFAAGEFHCHVIQGTHREVLAGPQFQELAGHLKACLERAQELS